jgi:hypothetical protein
METNTSPSVEFVSRIRVEALGKELIAGRLDQTSFTE